MNRITAIYDAALSKNRWTAALDAIQQGTQTAGMMFYSNNDIKPIAYNAQGVSSSYSWISEHLPDYNVLVADPEIGTGLDAEGAAYMHGQPAFEPRKDSDLWKLDDAFVARPEIQFTRDRLKVHRRFFLNLSEDPLTFSALIAHYDVQVSTPKFEDDIPSVVALAPHFAKALEMNHTVSSLRTKYNAVLSVLDMVNVPVCVVQDGGHVLVHNKRAAALFDKRDGIWLSKDGKLTGRHRDDLDRLGDATDRISRTANGENTEHSHQIEIRRLASDTPLFAVVSPLRDAEMELEPGLAGALVTLVEGEHHYDLDVNLIARAYGLSEAESRAMPYLLDGFSNAETADSLGVSPETVKSQVSSILSKTNCKNRLMLLWRVFQWSPPIL